MDGPCPRLATVGEIARRLGRPTHRIEYLIRTRRIAPRARVANLRVFGPADVEYLASELSRNEAERERKHRGRTPHRRRVANSVGCGSRLAPASMTNEGRFS